MSRPLTVKDLVERMPWHDVEPPVHYWRLADALATSLDGEPVRLVGRGYVDLREALVATTETRLILVRAQLLRTRTDAWDYSEIQQVELEGSPIERIVLKVPRDRVVLNIPDLPANQELAAYLKERVHPAPKIEYESYAERYGGRGRKGLA